MRSPLTRRALARRALPAAVLLALLAGSAAGQTSTWTGAGGDGDWFNPANWSSGVPQSSMLGGLITTGSGLTVNLNLTADPDNRLEIASLEYRSPGSTFTVTNGTLAVLGNYAQSANLLQGSSRSTATLDVGGTFTLDGGGTQRILSLRIVPRDIWDIRPTTPIDICDSDVDHRAPTTWSAGTIRGGMGTTWNIADTGSFTITGDGNFEHNGIADQPILNNAGIIEKNGGTGTTAFQNVTFSNTGTLRVRTGTFQTNGLALTANTLADGTWIVEDNATLDLQGASITTNRAAIILRGNASSFAALNTLTTNDTEGELTLENNRIFAPAAALTNNGSITLRNGSGILSSNTVANAGSITLQNASTLDTGDLSNATATTISLDNSTLTYAGAFTNNGTLRLTNAASAAPAGAGSLTNLSAAGTLAGGSYELDNATLTLQNTTITTLAADLQLSGTADVRGAGAGSIINDIATISPGARLALLDGRSLSTSQDFTVSNGATLEVDQATTFSVAPGRILTNFASGRFEEGTFTIRGEVIADDLEVSVIDNELLLGTVSGRLINRTTGLDALASLDTIDTNGRFTLTDGRSLTTAADLALNAGATLTLGLAGAANPGSLIVNGALNQAAGSTLALGGGSLTATSLNLNGSVTGSGTINGQIQTGGNVNIGNSPGLLTLTGNLTITPSALYTFDIAGLLAGSEHDRITINGSLIFDGDDDETFAGRVSLVLDPRWAPNLAEGQVYDLITATNVSGTFAAFDTLRVGDLLLVPQIHATGLRAVVVAIPTPGALALLSVAGLVANRRRRPHA